MSHSTDQNKNRPPVVSIMGHIDHGKSTLLDYIRKTKVTEGEIGGITQKMSAYKVTHDSNGESRSITFLDTPGHESFQELRKRGASVADIGILVVAADEGVKPQTVEAVKSIRAANLSMIVVINKMDHPNANPDKVKNGLLEHEVYVEGYGGDTPVVEVSAVTGQGIDALLDMIILLSDILDLKADPSKRAEGIIIEAQNDKKKGISATMIVKDGTLSSGEFVTSEGCFAPTRIMEDFQGKKITEAVPSDPVKVVGFNSLPIVGTIFTTVATKKQAEEEVEKYKLSALKQSKTYTIGSGEEISVFIPVIIKASTTDVSEALIHEIKKINNERVGVKIISAGIGFISESDVKNALVDPNTIILGFEVTTDASARTLAERENVSIQTFNIIYKLSEWLEAHMKEKTPKLMAEEITGRAKILKFFSKVKDRQVIGGRVEEGFIQNGEEVKVLRRDTEVARGKVRELQQARNKTSQVDEGAEFGAMIECKIDLAPGDKIETFRIVEK